METKFDKHKFFIIIIIKVKTILLISPVLVSKNPTTSLHFHNEVGGTHLLSFFLFGLVSPRFVSFAPIARQTSPLAIS